MRQRIVQLFFLLSAFIFLFSGNAEAQKGFTIHDGAFFKDGKAFQIRSGEMHYSRIPKAYWRQRFQMMKAMGLNTVATYVFWNYHEIAPGKWDFKTGNRDLAEYIREAGEEGLAVILRPGPYVCAEWNYGGYPWWLKKNPDLKIRMNNPAFLDSCRNYLQHLYKQVDGLFASQGGPIILTQVENEFGSYVSQRPDISKEDHRSYKMAVFHLLKQIGFPAPFFTSDASSLFADGSIPGVLPAANGEGDLKRLKEAVNKYHNQQGPYMVAEYYPGWLDHWGEKFNRVGTPQVLAQVKTYLDARVNFNFYMIHGGTNFGFTAGANENADHPIQPDLTSYDYDAPMNEVGWSTPKYEALRKLIQSYLPDSLPKVPLRIPVVCYQSLKAKGSSDVLDLLTGEVPVSSSEPLTFSELNQGQGYVLYEKHFKNSRSGILEINGLRDYAVVYVGHRKVGILDRRTKQFSLKVNIPSDSNLRILVEEMGYINYGAMINQNQKGIVSPVKLNGKELKEDWKMYGLPMTKIPKVKRKNGLLGDGSPVFIRFQFNARKIGDTFLDMSHWGKGIVFVNGHNLGRYWSIGPQQTLYLPGCWLKKKDNEVLVFEQLNDQRKPVLEFIDHPIPDHLNLK